MSLGDNGSSVMDLTYQLEREEMSKKLTKAMRDFGEDRYAEFLDSEDVGGNIECFFEDPSSEGLQLIANDALGVVWSNYGTYTHHISDGEGDQHLEEGHIYAELAVAARAILKEHPDIPPAEPKPWHYA